MLRTVIATLAWLTTLAAAAQTAAPPELAVVTAPEALVHSGPSTEFYPTARLQSGERVEIYRRKDDGWCAIRPPEGSFSYVRADHVRPTESAEILEVTQGGTKTRVGSSLQSAHKVEYITLKVGERLERLDGPVRLARSRYTWYLIAPPSGEFRWIRAQDVESAHASRSSNEDLTLQATSEPAPVPPSAKPLAAAQAAANHEEESEADAIESTPAASSHDTGGISFEKLSQARSHMSTERIPESPPPAGPPIALASHAESQDHSEDPGVVAEEPSTWTVVDAAPLAGEFPTGRTPVEEPASSVSEVSDPDLRLSEIELALSRMVTQEVDRWNLGPLRQQVAQLVAYLPDESGRRSAQQLLERIEEFAVLQRRHRDLATPSEADRAREISLTAALTQRSGLGGLLPAMANLPPDPPNQFAARQAAIRRHAEDAHYAGEGYLVPVISSQPNVPRFALTDAQGSILAFVSPRPGLNLRRYQRREVGIVGRETMRSDEQAPHLVADRVVVLDRQAR